MHFNERDGFVLRPVLPYGLHPNDVTIAEVLSKQGNATAIVGKWHLGDQTEFLPTRQGFDWFFGVPYAADMTERAMRSFFTSMATPTAAAQEQLKALGLQFIDSSGNIKPLATTVDEFSTALSGMPAGEQMRILNTVFDKQTASAFGGLMAAGGDELRKVEGDLQAGGGFSADAAEKRLDNVAGAFTKVKSAMSGMAIDVFQTIEGPLQSGLESLAEVIGGPTARQTAVIGTDSVPQQDTVTALVDAGESGQYSCCWPRRQQQMSSVTRLPRRVDTPAEPGERNHVSVTN